ncbi:hypothetical protein Tco_1303056 [Tanacetum coccineum]
MENQSDVQNHLVEIQANDHDLLVNSDNENDDMLGYESEKYSDDEDADGTNHSDLKLVKRGITRLYKFRREYGKPGRIKIKVTFDALTRVSGLHRALFSSFLGDLVRENIGLKILSWKKEKSARGKMARSKNVYHHKMGRGGYVLVKEKMIENKEIEVDEEPSCGIMWLKGRVNKNEEFTDDEIRSVGDKLIKEGTLNLDDGTDAMTVVFGKEKGGYARGVGSGVTYKRYFHLPRSRQATDERIELLQTQLDNERRERQQKDELLVAQGVQLNFSSQLQVASDVTPIGAYEVDETQSSVVVRDKDARIKKKSNGLVTSEKEPVKTVGPKKTPKSRRNGSQDSQSQGNVSPTQELPTASKCKLWHLKKSNIVALGTVYKSAGKQMLHNQALPNDCYKVSIDSSLVDAACIPDVGNNRLKTVKDGVGGFFAWPNNQVFLDEEWVDRNGS